MKTNWDIISEVLFNTEDGTDDGKFHPVTIVALVVICSIGLSVVIYIGFFK